MSDESMNTDLVELVRGFWASATRRDWDAILRSYAPDAVWDLSAVGLGTYQGKAAMRGLWEDWVDAYEQLELDVDAYELGSGIVLAMVRQNARPVGSSGHVQAQQVFLYTWVDGKVKRATIYPDIEQARAAAERLAESRT